MSAVLAVWVENSIIRIRASRSAHTWTDGHRQRHGRPSHPGAIDSGWLQLLAAADHRVGEVDTRDLDVDEHLAGSGRRRLPLLAAGDGGAPAVGTRVAGWVEAGGAYANRVIVPVHRAYEVPEDIPAGGIAAVFLQGTTADNAVHRGGRSRSLLRLCDQVRDGALKPRYRTAPLEQAPEIHRRIGERTLAGKVVLVP